MKYLFLSLFLLPVFLQAQVKTYDILTYTPPKGWKSGAESTSGIQYVKTAGTNWAQVNIFKNTKSLGSPEADLSSEWDKLAGSVYGIKEISSKTSPEKTQGQWKKSSATGSWVLNGKTVTTTVTTFTGYDAALSIVFNTTDPSFVPAYKQFMAGLKLQAGNAEPGNPPVITNGNNDNPPVNNTSPVSNGFKFNTTRFDDGWNSAVQEDWVEVVKGSVKVLIHYPKEGTVFPADPDKLTTAAWNILVSPRYNGLSNFKTSYVEDYNRPYFGTGYATEKSTGQKKLVVLFRRSGGWIEIVTPDNATFTKEFGFNPESIQWGKLSEYLGGYVLTNSEGNTVQARPEIFNKLDNMVTYNKFAVAASDLDNSGRWDATFSSNTYYANYYTGAYAGMTTYSSSQWFIFKPGQKYHWELVAANSGMGQIQTAQSKSDGTFKSLNDWQILCSGSEGKQKTYDAYFSAIKGGRVLWLNDAKFPGSGIFTGFSK